jgi:hypothetical protein
VLSATFYERLLLSTLFSLGTIASARQQQFFYDQFGWPAGAAYQYGNSHFFFDQFGRPAGSAYRYGNSFQRAACLHEHPDDHAEHDFFSSSKLLSRSDSDAKGPRHTMLYR